MRGPVFCISFSRLDARLGAEKRSISASLAPGRYDRRTTDAGRWIGGRLHGHTYTSARKAAPAVGTADAFWRPLPADAERCRCVRASTLECIVTGWVPSSSIMGWAVVTHEEIRLGGDAGTADHVCSNVHVQRSAHGRCRISMSSEDDIVFLARPLLGRGVRDMHSNKQGYLLLRCIRIYLVLDMYASLDVHTDETIAAGERALLQFESHIKEYAKQSDDEKNWNFPKIHSHQHLFDDIKAKGATRNYNTKPNEKLHGALKDAYALQTNKKNVASQILNIDHYTLVMALLQQQIDLLDKDQALVDDDLDEEPQQSSILSAGHTILGARQPLCSFQDIDDEFKNDGAFKNLSQRLSLWLTEFFVVNGISLPNDTPIKLGMNGVVRIYLQLTMSN
ncbi:hypothetical protein EW146_g5390 [Bondarzewia mesenterica]|uniref:Uncharacterized protein n=1 Tax=Bondarzewia mesenterica TaxID=1095465 RepID=A0A4S4LTJ1_9AGAM|nr:hypothetical protein EW146_g5390 [Bondarzewia mesenterica]